jgi:hypothetical protein
MFVVMLLLRELLAPCSSSCCDAEYNVFITLVHTHTQKKKKLHLLCEVDVVTNEEVHYIWYQSGFNPRLGIATAFVDMIDYTVANRVDLCACR